MATLTLTMIPEVVTVPANTSEHDINFDNVLAQLSVATIPGTTKNKSNEFWRGTAIVKLLTGTSIQFNSNGIAISAISGSLTSANDEMILPIEIGVPLKYKGSAGSETFQIILLPELIVD